MALLFDLCSKFSSVEKDLVDIIVVVGNVWCFLVYTNAVVFLVSREVGKCIGMLLAFIALGTLLFFMKD